MRSLLRKTGWSSILFSGILGLGLSLLSPSVKCQLLEPLSPPSSIGEQTAEEQFSEDPSSPEDSSAPAPPNLSLRNRFRNTITGYRQTYRINKALNMLKKYMESYPDDSWALIQRSECHLALLEFVEAETDANQAFKMGENPSVVYLQLARVYQKWGQTEMARDHFDLAQETASDNPEIFYQAGQFYMEQEEYPKAVESFSKAVEFRPDVPDYLYALAKALDASGELEQAMDYYLDYIKIQFQGTNQYLQLGELFMAKKMYPEALSCYQELEKMLPEDFKTYMLLGKAYSASGDYRKAIDTFLKAYQLDSENPQPLLAMAQICRMAKDYDRALQIYMRAYNLDPKNPAPRFGRARIFAERRELDKAEFETRATADLLKDNYQVQALLAALLQAQGKVDEAKQCLQGARKLNEDADALYQKYLEDIPPEPPADEIESATEEVLNVTP